jgi:hypothetical protein
VGTAGLEAVGSDAAEIKVQGTISGVPMITLRPGVTLRGGVLEFGAKGVRLSSQNTLDAVTVHTADDEVAILNDTSVEDLGTHVTHGDGSIGVQVSRLLPVLEIKGELSTEGGEGMSLVKGVQMTLKAIALSVEPGGSVGKVTIGGELRTTGANRADETTGHAPSGGGWWPLRSS